MRKNVLKNTLGWVVFFFSFKFVNLEGDIHYVNTFILDKPSQAGL